MSQMNQQNHTHQQDILSEVKDRLDIIDIISEHVVLKKAGRNYWGNCPFHKEKTPSFSVNPDKNIFKCFGCGASGDAISFLMKINNQNFRETLGELALRFGLQMPVYKGSSDNTELKTQIIKLNEEAVKFFTNNLIHNPDAQKARDYLTKRTITSEIIERFSIGFAPNKYDALINHLKEKCNASEDLMEKSGLVSAKNNGNGYIDRFRNRVIIPIHDEKGNVIAFGARALDDNQTPKYLNSPDTPVFNKGRNLYGLFQAKESIRLNDSVLIMEGYFDVITAHINGLNNVVAMLGTALTEQHIKLLARYTESRKIYLAFDSDEAGINATNRGAEVIKSVFEGLGEIRTFDASFTNSDQSNDRTSCEIRVVKANTGKDPDEFIRTEGIDAYKKLIKSAPLLIDYEINRIIVSKGLIKTPQEKANTVKQLMPLLLDIKNSIIRDEYIHFVAEKVGINHDSLGSEVKKLLQKNTVATKGFQTNLNKKIEKHILAQKNLLCLYFINSEYISLSSINEKLKEVAFTEPHLTIAKTEIENLISNNITNNNEFTKELLTKLEDNEEAKQEIIDIIFSLEDRNNINYGLKSLESELLIEFISENIACLNRFVSQQEQSGLITNYRSANDDELTALQLQYKVRELIKSNQNRME